MSEQYPGGYITKSPVVPTSSAAPGIWTLSQQAGYQSTGTWPSPPAIDAQFNYVTMLLHGDGTNGAQNNTFVDSGYGWSVTRNGNTTQGSFSPYGSNWSNSFNGTNAYLQAAVTSLTGQFTVEFMYYSTTSGTNYGITFGDSSTSTGLEIYQSGGNLVVWSNNGFVISGSAGSSNSWVHVALTRDGSNNIKLFVNGAQQGSTWVSSATFSSTLRIGVEYYGSAITGYCSGYISNLRILNVTSTPVVPTAPLTAISGTTFLTCQSNRFIDNSSNAYAITVNGSPSVQRFNPFGTTTAYATSDIGGSAYFDGSGDYLTVAANSANLGLGDFAITFWMYCTSSSGDSVPATNAYDGASFSGGWYFYCSSGTSVSFGIGSPTGTDAVSGNANGINAWHYIEATRSGSTLSIYIDGVLAQSKTNTNSGSASGNTTKVGAQYGGGARYFPGYITDFRVSGSAGHTSNYTPPTSPASASGAVILLSATNAAIYDNAMMSDLETAGNAQISTSVKKYGTGSLKFDGVSDFLSTPVSPLANLTGDFTVEFWAYLNDQDAQDFIGTATWAYYIGSGQSGWSVSYASGLVSFSYQSNNSYVIATNFAGTTLTNSVWYHVAVVRSGGTIKCYINGTASATTISSSTSFVSTTYGVWVGCAGKGDTYSYELNGYLDDVRITNGYARYTTNFTPPTAAFPNTGP